MSKFSNLKVELKKLIAQLGEITTDKATLIYAEDSISIDTYVFIQNEDGEYVPAPDGEYVGDDNRTYTVKDGAISEIYAEAPIADEPSVELEEEAPAEETPAEEKTEDNSIADLKAQIDELYEIVNGLTAKIAALDTSNATMSEQLKKVCEMSAIEPAEIEIDKKEASLSTKDRNLAAMIEGIKEASR